MPVAKGIWGIDIGQCALKALRLELVDGKPTATAFDYVEHTKILSQPDADQDTLIREALEKFLSRNQIKLDEVAIGIAGQSGLARFVKLPPVEEKKIAEIVKFEAKQQIPFPLDEVVWDFQKIAGGEAVDGFALETEIGLFAMKRDVISRYMGYFGGSKIEVHTVQMSPLALVNFATYEILKKGGAAVPEDTTTEEEAADDAPRGKKRCAVVMDIGTDASNLIITDGAKIIWQRPIPLGGNNFTRALTKELKLTFAKAEHLKRNAAKSPEMANILKAIKPVLTDFVGEVQRSLGYFTNTHRDAHVAYLVGLGSAFKLPGLQKYLSDKLSLDVRKPTKFARLSGDAVLSDPLFQENVLTFPIAYGLALQGLGLARLSTNLLPGEIRMDRLIRAKKPYAAAAAALLVLGTVGFSLGYSSPYAAIMDDSIKKAEKETEDAVAAFNRQDSEFKKREEESRKTKARVKSIIAGQEERLNWPRFLEVETAAMPRPGKDGNLDNPEQRSLWRGEGDKGVEAWEWFKRRMETGVPINEAQFDAQSKEPLYLAMVNVEAIHSRWVNNVAKFLDAADTKVAETFKENIADTMKDEERERDEAKDRYKPKAKEGPGWVIEIRGYTDHKDGPNFLKGALIKNLQRFDDFAKKTGEDKVGKYIVEVKDPIREKVSHPFIYKFWRVEDAQPNYFVNIDQSYLDALLASGGQTGGPGGPSPVGRSGGLSGSQTPPQPGAPTSSAPATSADTALGPPWQAFGAASTAASGPGMSGGGGFNMKPNSPSSPGPSTRPSGGSPGSGTTDPKEERRLYNRYEFIVMLIWREPVPSSEKLP